MYGIAALESTGNVKLLIESDNEKGFAELRKTVEDLKTVIGKLQSRIDKLESNVKILDNKWGVVKSTVPSDAAARKVTSAAPNAASDVLEMTPMWLSVVQILRKIVMMPKN